MAMLWFFSLNGIRQAIAISFCLLALFKYFNKKILWFFILTGLGSLFHKSALFISLIGILALIPIRQSLKMYLFPWIFIGFITFTFISMSIVTFYIEQILSISGLTKYASYFGSEHFSEREFGSGLGILIKVLFSIYIIINSKSILNLNKNYWCLILLVFIYTLGAILANNIIIFSRMADTFVISIIISSYVLLQIPDNIRLNKIIVILFSIFLLLSFIKTSFGIPTTYSDPMLNPYDSIL